MSAEATGTEQAPASVRFELSVVHLPSTPAGLLGPRPHIDLRCGRCRERVPVDAAELIRHARLHEPGLGR